MDIIISNNVNIVISNNVNNIISNNGETCNEFLSYINVRWTIIQSFSLVKTFNCFNCLFLFNSFLFFGADVNNGTVENPSPRCSPVHKSPVYVGLDRGVGLFDRQKGVSFHSLKTGFPIKKTVKVGSETD